MDPQAVIGFSFRLPQGITDDATLWDALLSRRNLATEWPADRAQIESFYDGKQEMPNRLPTRLGHFLSQDIAAFDAPFFSITSQEAVAMDPQQRWILETTYHAFENAGLSMESLQGSRTGVFAGSMADDFTRLLAKDPDTMPRTAITGTSPSLLANKVSWFYNLTGPSMHVDSACSSSLTALDLACQALRNGSASQAVVIGSSVMLSPESSTLLSNMSFLSPDGVSYSFDHRANGYARGEGIIAMIIKPVTNAVEDGDVIRAVIRATLSNQDGRTPGLTQPSSDSQEKLIREVYRRADLKFDSTRYVEAHGTGTPIGDPTEMEAIRKVFGAYRSAKSPLYVGSVKPNIGHLEGGSGLAGIIKSILVLEKGIIPPNALFEYSNPNIDCDSASLIVPDTSVSWPSNSLRRVSVNSFGFGGSNCHIILDDSYHYLLRRSLIGLHNCCLLTTTESQEYRQGYVQSMSETSSTPFTPRVNQISAVLDQPDPQSKEQGESGFDSRPTHLLVWSAHDEGAMARTIQNYERYYAQGLPYSIADLSCLAYTLAARRTLMTWRAFAVIGESKNSPSNKVAAKPRPIRASNRVSLAMVFTGQGAQYARMGLELLSYPAFDDTLRQADSTLKDLGCEWSIYDELNNRENIHLPQYGQPLCTAIQLALLSLLASLGIIPTAVIGHSSGEIAAAYATGALTLQSAMKVAFYRGSLVGKLMAEKAQKSGMMSVNLSEGSLQSYLQNKSYVTLGGNIHIACINSPLNVTISGDEGVLDTLRIDLESDEIFTAKLNTGVAYHSPAMDEIGPMYLAALGSLDRDTSASDKVIMISSVTGQAIHSDRLSESQYWVENLVSPVRFSEAVSNILIDVSDQRLKTSHITDIIEIGPHSALQRPIKDILTQGIPDTKRPRYHSVLHKSKSAMLTVLSVLGELFCLGHPVSINKVNQYQAAPACKKRPVPFLIDYPKYPFDHSHRYWRESRLARDFRLRAPVPSDTLGSRVHDWNPLEPRWRNLLSTESMPWIADHRITETAIFPGAGMLVMATEAVKQVAYTDRELFGYYIEEAHFLNPLIVNESVADATESLVHLRRLQEPFEKESTRFEVIIYAYYQQRWSRCFRATIQAQYEELDSQTGMSTERKLQIEHVRQKHHNVLQSCVEDIGSRKFYSYCKNHGFNYGDSFQLLDDMRWNGKDLAAARITRTSSNSQVQSLVHPTILDAGFHLSLVQVSHGLSQPIATMVPYQLFNTWISAKHWDDSLPLQVSSAVTDTTSAHAEVSISIISANGNPLSTVGRLVISAVSSNNTVERKSKNDGLIHRIEWMPLLSLQTPHELSSLCCNDSDIQKETEMIKFYCRLKSALTQAARSVLESLSEADIRRAPTHLQKLIASLQHQIKDFQTQGSTLPGNSEVENIFSQTESENPGWRIFPVVARNLKAILLGKTDALDIVYSTGLADSFYRSIFDHICDERFHRFMELLTHENPSLKIIEAGAGTGGMTRHILSSLHELEHKTGTTRYGEYMYTDISPSFFENARAEFDGHRISFRTLDVETDASQQGLENGTYDLVIAGGVIHATKNLDSTLRNVRRLLKPGGHLLLVEIIAPESIHANIGFGVLPGWWLSEEEYRAYSPAITEKQWDDALRRTGFSGNDLALRDYQNDACHFSSLLVSTAIRQPPAEQERFKLVLLVNAADMEQLCLAEKLSQKFGSAKTLPLSDIHQANLTAEEVVISLVEVTAPFLAGVREADFIAVQQLIRKVTNLCWVTSTWPEHANYPHYSAITGLLRTVRAEAIEKRIISLSIESVPGNQFEHLANYISLVLDASIGTDDPEVEFIVRGGHITCGRLVEDVDVDEKVRASVEPQKKSETLGIGPPLVLSVGTSGLLDTLQFIEDPSSGEDLIHGQLEVEAKAWAMSFRDVLVALGRVKGTDLGWDAAGVVTRVGPGCNLSPGDRVGLGAPGSMRTLIRTDAESVFRIPDTMSFEEAVSFINPACTAYHCLINMARLQKGEKILIHSAAGATGQMAIWIAKYCGAEIFATVGSQSKKQLLVDRFDLAPTHIFHSRDTSFAQGISRLTDGCGVDVILNSLSGDGLRASWESIAPYGRFIEIGKADITSNSSLPMANFQKNVSFSAVDLHHMAQTRPALLSDLMHNVLDLVASNIIRYPYPLHLFGTSEVENAFRAMQGGINAGRNIIQVKPSESVPKFLRYKSDWRLNANASYLIAGGLGGLGRAICKWMVDKGANHLIILSRSGMKTVAGSQAVEQLQSRGVHVKVLTCDATSYEALVSALSTCASSMPPIKGCINAAMALQDGIFDTLPHSRWDYTLRSKLDTSWNLHQLLPKGLDFFVLLSSLSGLYGTVSLSNYAAGCTFQDALARYRNSIGDTAVSLDIGWMRTIGIIAETELYQRNREKARDMRPIEEAELLSLLDLCCDPSSPYGQPGADRSQVLIGATTPAFFLRRGETPIAQVQSRMFSGFLNVMEAKTTSGSRIANEHVVLFREAKDPEDRLMIVVNALAGKLARALSVAAEYIEAEKPLSHYGVDSLMAVELRNWFINDFDAKVAVFEIMGHTPIIAISKLIVERAILDV
ncbi:hypothetical protein BKA67DRAFT_664483 [Truncatella angustata]|uniref:Carrier domain-containing protein n=1 Tax=Truncatella angustata TaxID=152316 RepID=A0A9P8RLM0_9PEZI|nr:uncharacterized protein BKA67DRAFT_664483 [Truncatella angustata]KAH6645401.1 hypothetical protein BKA67DRAFT_664483 [Truncatella angustata]